MLKKLSRIVPILLALPLIFAFGSAQAQGTVFKIWWFDKDNAQSKAYNVALDAFKVKHPDVTVQFEQKTFEQTVETARMVLNSNDVPDVMEINKGNATAGLYAKQGLLTNLNDIAVEKGWDKLMSPSVQVTCRYDANGIMGTGDLYGVTNYGEYVMVYYNKPMFAKMGVTVPTTLEELEAINDKFVAAGIIPFTLGDFEKWPPSHNWYEFVMYKADKDFINQYQLLQGDIDFKTNEALNYGTNKFVEWVSKGYYNPNANGTKYDDANAAFVQQKYPMNLTGSWQYGTFMDQIKDFEWGTFLMPGKKMVTGSGGNLWIVPTNAAQKDLAYDFIDLTMQAESQTAMANAGGIPIHADLTKITDPKILELNKNFNTIVENDGLSYYPDWPVPGYLDTIGAGLQELLDKSKTAAEFLDEISGPFQDYKSSL